MPVTILIPTALRPYSDGQRAVEVAGGTVGEAIDALTTRYDGLGRHLRTAEGSLRSFVNVYLNDEDVRYLDREGTKLGAGDTITIVPSIAGGRR